MMIGLELTAWACDVAGFTAAAIRGISSARLAAVASQARLHSPENATARTGAHGGEPYSGQSKSDSATVHIALALTYAAYRWYLSLFSPSAKSTTDFRPTTSGRGTPASSAAT